MSEDIGALVESEAVAVLDRTPMQTQAQLRKRLLENSRMFYLVKGPSAGLLEYPTVPADGHFATVELFSDYESNIDRYVINGRGYSVKRKPNGQSSKVCFVDTGKIDETGPVIEILELPTETRPYLKVVKPDSSRLPALGAYLKQQNGGNGHNSTNGNGHHK